MRFNDVKKISGLAAKQLSIREIKELSMQFFQHEKEYSFSKQANSARLAFELFKEAGAETELRNIKADGKTANMDYIMPQAWDAFDAKLEMLSPFKETLSDYKTDRFMLPMRCPATPAGGITGELILEKDAGRKGVRGKFILSSTYKMCGWDKMKLLKTGAAGIISYWSESGDKLPDSVFWTNGWTMGPGWYHTADEPRILMMNISRNKGLRFEKLLKSGKKVTLKAFADTKTYSAVQHTATALIRGESEKEIAIAGHLYEPMPSDNCICAASMTRFVSIINGLIREKKLPRPRYSLRFILGAERYGISEFFKDRKRAGNIIANMNFDGFCVDHKKAKEPSQVRYAPVCNTSFTDILLDELVAKYNTAPLQHVRGNFSDDTFMSDPLVSAPCTWFWQPDGPYHHNSENTYETVDWKRALEKSSVALEYILTLAYMDPQAAGGYLPSVEKGLACHIDLEFSKLLKRSGKLSKKELVSNMYFVIGWQLRRLESLSGFGASRIEMKKAQIRLGRHIEKALEIFGKAKTRGVNNENLISSEERKAANIIPFRLAKYPPSDMAKEKDLLKRPRNAPSAENFVAWMDGNRTLWDVIKLLEMDLEKTFTSGQQNTYINYARDLERLGYIKFKYRTVIGRKEIISGLKLLGIKKGDRIMVHSSLASLGKVKGGPEAVIDALKAAVGKSGLLMMPSFNHGDAARNPPYYFDMKKTSSKNGVIADTFWRLPGVKRSVDPSHAFAAWGKNSEQYLAGHRYTSTMGPGSPLELLERGGGKVVLLGTGYAPNTFRHVVEMTNNVKCLGQRTEEYPVKLPSGKMIKARTWSWRNGGCPLLDDVSHSERLMKERGLDKLVKIGNAETIIFNTADFRRVAEELLAKGVPGKPNCKDCKMKIAFTGTKEGVLPLKKVF